MEFGPRPSEMLEAFLSPGSVSCTSEHPGTSHTACDILQGFRTIAGLISHFNESVHELSTEAVLAAPEPHFVKDKPPATTLSPACANQPAVQQAFDSLGFFTSMQALWQPAALVRLDSGEHTATVVSWFVDHVRQPMAFASRRVRPPGDPTQWLPRLRQTWRDMTLPLHDLHFYIVQPQPPQLEAQYCRTCHSDTATPPGFRSALVTALDSDQDRAVPYRHAAMVPGQATLSTLIGLAYLDVECSMLQNACTAWVGERELSPDHPLQV